MSTNISKEKRDGLIQKIQSIRKYLSEAKQDENTGNLLMYLNELEKDIKGKKYGLVFEEHREAIDDLMDTHTPALTEEKDLFIDKGGRMNFLIEGDNLPALYLLQKTHKNKIDIIYIDPPYNTQHSLTYDDKRIGEDDEFRHSKWLSFMEKRLKIAQKLLCKTGVIFISIDDNEDAQLKLLCNSIFGEDNLIGVFAVIKAEGGGMAKQIVKGHDYLFVYARDKKYFKPLAKEKDIRGQQVTLKGERYWIQEDWLRKEFGKYGNCHYEEIIEYKGHKFKEEIDQGLKDGRYRLIKKKNGLHIVGKLRRIDEDSSKFYSVLKHLNADGVSTLKQMGLDKYFKYPKPVSLIKEVVKGASFYGGRAYTVLDFFAGSGTTGQAVLDLCEEDDIERNFILCTDNSVSEEDERKLIENGIDRHSETWRENGICRKVTYPRISKIINGYEAKGKICDVLFKRKLTINALNRIEEIFAQIDAMISKGKYPDYEVKIDNESNLILLGSSDEDLMTEIAGLKKSLKFYKIEFIPISEKFYYEYADELLKHIRELVELENGINFTGNADIAIILTDQELKDFIKNIDDFDKCRTLYLGHDVLIDGEQQQLFKKREIQIKVIPNYYYREMEG